MRRVPASATAPTTAERTSTQVSNPSFPPLGDSLAVDVRVLAKEMFDPEARRVMFGYRTPTTALAQRGVAESVGAGDLVATTTGDRGTTIEIPV